MNPTVIDLLIQQMLQNGPPSPGPSDALNGLMIPSPSDESQINPGTQALTPTLPTQGTDVIPPLAMPPTTVRQPNVVTSRDPDQRMDGWRSLLQNFTFSLASGLTARARNPRAGVGEALMAPFELQQRQLLERQRQQQIDTARATEERTRISGEQMMQMMRQGQAELPAKLEALRTGNALKQAQTATEQQRPGQVAAQTALTTAQTQAAKYKELGGQLFDISGPRPVQVGDTSGKITVTQTLADDLNLPKELIGKELRMQDINGFISASRPDETITELKDGKYLVNKKSGEKRKIGEAPAKAEAGTYIAVTNDEGQITGFANPKAGKTVSAGSLGIEGEYKGAVSPERFKMQNNGVSGLKAVAKLRGEIAKPGVLAALAIPTSPTARTARAARNEMIDVLTRIRTGAALNKDEEKFYKDQAPGLIDALFSDPETIEYKLSIFEDNFKAMAGSKAPKPNAPEEPPAGQKKIPGVQSYRKVPGGG